MTRWRIALARPSIDDSDRAAVLRVLDSPILSLGPEQRAFEKEFGARYEDAPAAAVSSGTAGLYLALRALGVDGGEVITPSYGFMGTVHAIRLAGAEPRFADIDARHLCVSPESIEACVGPQTRALLPVHLFGTPPPMTDIAAISQRLGVPLVEDTCEAIGAVSDGRPAGLHGDAAVFGFYPNKQMTTGEGGMVLARDPEVLDRIRSMRNQGRGAGEFEFVQEGFNFRLTEMQAALGRSQLLRLDALLAERDRLADLYSERLTGTPGLHTLPPVAAGDRRSWFVFPVFVDDPDWRAPVRNALAARGIQTAPYFPALHTMLPASQLPSTDDLSVTEAVAARSFALPFYPGLGGAAVDEVAEALREALVELGAEEISDSLQTALSPAT